MTSTSNSTEKKNHPPSQDPDEASWPIGFNKDGEPNVVGYLTPKELEELRRRSKIKNSSKPPPEAT